MPYHQLTKYQRNELAALLRGGKHSLREIAEVVGVHHSTVSRELRRHASPNLSGYDARIARLALRYKRLCANQQHRKLPTLELLAVTIDTKLRANWSPQQIAGWLIATKRVVRVCAQTIYDWIYRFRADLKRHLHCRKGKYRRTRANTLRKAFRDAQKEQRRITNRPRHVTRRKRYGHWEGDTIVGKGRSAYIATFVERKSGYLIARLLPQATAAGFMAAATAGLALIAGAYRKTLTLDNGTEMRGYEAIEARTGLRVYFANPYHSWERGTNENTNGLLRFYFPKAMRFDRLTQSEVDKAVAELNTRPRKRLDYKTPAQVLKARGALRTRI